MKKEIIILTKSSKNNEYCVAGKDISNGKWIRVVSETDGGEVPKKDVKYSDGSEVEILDIVEITFKKHEPKEHQCENYIYDNNVTWKKMERNTVEEIKNT